MSGSGLVLQHKPLIIMVFPLSSVITPPDMAEFSVIEVIALVVTDGPVSCILYISYPERKRSLIKPGVIALVRTGPRLEVVLSAHLYSSLPCEFNNFFVPRSSTVTIAICLPARTNMSPLCKSDIPIWPSLIIFKPV